MFKHMGKVFYLKRQAKRCSAGGEKGYKWHKQNGVQERIQCPRGTLADFPISLEALQLLKDCQSLNGSQPSGMIYIPFLAPQGHQLACSTF